MYTHHRQHRFFPFSFCLNIFCHLRIVCFKKIFLSGTGFPGGFEEYGKLYDAGNPSVLWQHKEQSADCEAGCDGRFPFPSTSCTAGVSSKMSSTRLPAAKVFCSVLPRFASATAGPKEENHWDRWEKRKREIHTVKAVHAFLGCGKWKRGDFRHCSVLPRFASATAGPKEENRAITGTSIPAKSTSAFWYSIADTNSIHRSDIRIAVFVTAIFLFFILSSCACLSAPSTLHWGFWLFWHIWQWGLQYRPSPQK